MIYDINKDGFCFGEEHFDSTQLGKCESIMCQGNGYMGIRAATEEGYLTAMRGTFVAGSFSSFAGEVTELPNAPDVIGMDITVDGHRLDLTVGQVSEYLRWLNMKDGTMQRKFLWTAPNGAELSFCFERVVSLADRHIVAQRVTIVPLSSAVEIGLSSGIDGRITNSGTQHFCECEQRFFDQCYLRSHYRTAQSQLDFVLGTVHSYRQGSRVIAPESEMRIERRRAAVLHRFSLQRSESLTIEKVSVVHTSRDCDQQYSNVDEMKDNVLEHLRQASSQGYDAIALLSATAWQDKVWRHRDMEIRSANSFDQLAARFAIYHLTVMTPAHDRRMNIGAKGLSGEGYKGHTFWDTEVFMLPHYIFTNPETARSLLEYRYLGLDGARRKASENGYVGAMYPWESAWITDGEVTPLMGAADVVTGEAMPILTGMIEQHITADVAYGVELYYLMTGDNDFMKRYGYEIIIETAKFWQSRLEYNPSLDRYEIHDVIGPDEYKEHVSNNAYTNYMAHWNICKAMSYCELLRSDYPELYRELDTRLDIAGTEKLWRDKVSRIYLPQINSDGILPQDDAYLTLQELDLAPYKASDIVGTIYDHYNMEQISKLQVSKQADVLVLLMLFDDMLPLVQKQRNFDYYERHCLHDSSLSLSTHSVLASDLGKKELAYKLFERACRIDLGEVMNSSNAGVHAASFGGVWQCVVNGFVGVRLVGGKLQFKPCLPDSWVSVQTKLFYRGSELVVNVTKDTITIVNESGIPQQAIVCGVEMTLQGKTVVPLK